MKGEAYGEAYWVTVFLTSFLWGGGSDHKMVQRQVIKKINK